MFCLQCGKPNDISAKFCFSCGTSLPQVSLTSSEIRADGKELDYSDDLYRAVIGPKNQNYYLKYFKRFDSEGKTSATWHWSAFFITFYWLLYRKMWLGALFYFFLPYLMMIPFGIIGSIIGDSSGGILGVGYLIYFIGIFVWYPMYANAMYYKHSLKKIQEVKASSNDLQRQIGELSGKGGTSSIIIIILLIFSFIFVIGILAAIAIPAYQDYITRSKLAQAMVVGKSAEEAFNTYYQEHHAIPASLDEAGFIEKLPPSIQRISVDQQTGVLNMVMADGVLKDKILLFVPSLQADNQMTWKCTSEDIAVKYVSHFCQQ